jgi:hypothetical protein
MKADLEHVGRRCHRENAERGGIRKR